MTSRMAVDGSTRITPFEEIPQKARAKATLITAEVSMIKGAPRPAPAPAPWVQPALPVASPSCATFSGKVATLEKSLATLPQPRLQPCAGLLESSSGGTQIAHAKCMLENEASIKAREERVASLTTELEVAGDELRRVQIAGCR